MGAVYRPECEHKGFALPCCNDFSQATRNKWPNGLRGRHKGGSNKQKYHEKIANQKHGSPKHAKTAVNHQMLIFLCVNNNRGRILLVLITRQVRHIVAVFEISRLIKKPANSIFQFRYEPEATTNWVT
jgi:hypothetical protein